MEEDDVNYQNTSYALDLISEVVTQVNESKRMLDSYSDIMQIQESIVDRVCYHLLFLVNFDK